MIDHALGRPSANQRRLEVLVSSFLAFLVLRHKSGPEPRFKILGVIDRLLGHLPAWKIVFGTLVAKWVASNFFLLTYMNGNPAAIPLYTRNYYRATWILTALDAGFLTAQDIKPKFLRDFLSMVFFTFYLLTPEAADEKVRRYRSLATTDMLRLSWEKNLNPYLRLSTFPDRWFLSIREDTSIPRPSPPSATSFPEEVPLPSINARLYFSGTREELRNARELIFQIPGGGFITQSPKCHDDYVSNWARMTKTPIIAIDYGKAPERPYPWAIEECYDAWRSVVESNGKVIGMQGWEKEDGSANPPLKICMVGDSAGGNIAVGVIMRCIETHEKVVPLPAGLVLIYPALSFDIACWMPSEQRDLMRGNSFRNLASTATLAPPQPPHVAKKDIKDVSPLAQAEAPRRIDVLKGEVDRRQSWYRRLWARVRGLEVTEREQQKIVIDSRLSMTSRMSFYTDRIIQLEMMRAMALLYLRNSPKPPDLINDYYLSPMVAPDDILALFPKTFFLVGEKDPFVDDTVVFAGRLRANKEKARKEWERTMQRARRVSLSHPISPISGDGGITIEVPSTTDTATRPRGLSTSSTTSTQSTAAETAALLPHHLFSHPPEEMVRVKILEGISHGFFQMLSILPEAKQATRLTSDWFLEMLGSPSDDAAVVRDEVLTDFMIDEIRRRDGAPMSPTATGAGTYYMAHSAPVLPPAKHILVEEAALDEVKERHILERRRHELEAILYGQ
ncbi:Alpha/Beta hydrolase protein [Blyttiomyces helicus]|uniref:Alpha/Beta hydrolase protein n=1 Tax=Blyttiomyces helicus TaxID=388810 RepID=A0A4P9WM11_9FUNG|nr:Alpha/Beta hydrolase protein [Blyttiomyces helicus]|eukprot:RKO94101.1 Alpha/Beta hydrolase protein [Blyttiomyces helicus]